MKRRGRGGMKRERKGGVQWKKAYIEQCLVGGEGDDVSEAVWSLASIGEVGITYTGVLKSGGIHIHKWG